MWYKKNYFIICLNDKGVILHIFAHGQSANAANEMICFNNQNKHSNSLQPQIFPTHENKIID